MPSDPTMSFAETQRPPKRSSVTDAPRWLRLSGLVLAAGCGSLLTVTGWLHPNPSGTGTHCQLGLPACEFLARTGWPCPSCGLTTSLSAMVHGQVAAAWQAHPFGPVMFAGLLVLTSAGAGQALTGRPLLRRLGRPLWWAVGGIVGLPLAWAVHLLTGWLNGTLPLR